MVKCPESLQLRVLRKNGKVAPVFNFSIETVYFLYKNASGLSFFV